MGKKRRREDVQALLRELVKSDGKTTGIGNPNLVEFNGDRLLRSQSRQSAPTEQAKPITSSSPGNEGSSSSVAIVTADTAPSSYAAALKAPRCACAGRAVLSNLAVNRVQSTYTTPVYATKGGGVKDLNRRLWLGGDFRESEGTTMATRDPNGAGGCEGGVVDAEARRVQRRCGDGGGEVSEEDEGQGRGGFDASLYRNRAFNSVHVGELAFGGVARDMIDGAAGSNIFSSNVDGDGGGIGGNGTGRVKLKGNDHRANRNSADIVAGAAGENHTDRRYVPDDNVHGSEDGGGATAAPVSSETQPDIAHQIVDATATPAGWPPRPVVTVLLPVKNGGAHLLDAVASVIDSASRCERDFGGVVELLVIDDGSDDGAVDLAVAAVVGDPVRNDRRGGLPSPLRYSQFFCRVSWRVWGDRGGVTWNIVKEPLPYYPLGVSSPAGELVGSFQS